MYMFMGLLAQMVNAMGRVLFAGRRVGDVTISGIRAHVAVRACMSHEVTVTEVVFHSAQQKS